MTAAAAVTVPGELAVAATAPPAGADARTSGFVVLTRGSDTRRIPFWADTATAALRAGRDP